MRQHVPVLRRLPFSIVRHPLLALGLGLATVALVGCSGDESDPSTADSRVQTTTVGGPGASAVIVADLDVTASRSDGVVLREVELPSAGYVGVYEDGDGAPGRLLGSSEQLPAGRTAEVRVPFDTSEIDPDAVWVILHGEDTGNDTLDWPDGDEPIEVDGSVVTLKIAVTD